MKLLVATDAHIFRTPDGKHWARSIYGYNFWKRYMDVFDSVCVVARVKEVDKINSKKLLVDGQGVEVYGIPFYQGPRQFLCKYIQIHAALKNVDNGCDAALLRMPSQTATMVWKHLRKDIPLAGEIVYNMMDDVKQPDQGLLLRIINIILSNNLKKFCIKANGVSYVTEKTIQEQYPSYARVYGADKRHFESFYSTITLSENAFTGPRNYINRKHLTLVLSSVSMNSERKGEKTLIEIVYKARKRDCDVDAVIIGDGKLRKSFEMYAEELNVKKYVKFTGLLSSSDEVREVMMNADVFVFPTQGEGLPRGILEAMAIGLPVLSTPVGGIAEIIDRKYLFDPLNSSRFADAICNLLNNSDELNKMSKDNYIKSLEFKNELLQMKRNNFYNRLKNLCNILDDTDVR